nr:MAG TPA: hypothetical protein [Caudoviricetes sp.]
MNKAHSAINWENYPSDETPVNERNLNKMDGSIDIIDDRVITLDTTKATKAEVATLVADVTFEESTGIITITKKNGSKITIDTQMEKIAINFDYNPTTQQIILTLIDGTKQYIDLSALITQYEFLDSDTVAFYIDKDGKVSAIVKEGSIEEKHLEPNYLAKIKVEVAKAESSMKNAATSENNAASSATKAESYAIGGTGARNGEDTDNAKYYSEQAKAIYGEMQKEQVTGVKGDNEAEYRYGNVNLTPENIGALPISGGKLTGQLQVGEKVKLYTSSEGGNIQIISPDDIGLRWELDAFKGDLRFICFNNDGTVKKICQLTRDGALIANNATSSAAGLMSPQDKGKLDNLPDNVVATNGDTSENTVTFKTASARENLKSGEKHNILFGKIAKWFADLKAVAFSGSYNDLSNKPTIPTVINNNTTTVAGYALDARQANPNVSGSMAAQMKSNYEPKLQIVSAASTAAGLGAGATRTDTIIITIPTGYSFTGFVICDYNNNSGKTLTTIQTVTVSGSNVTVLVLLYNTSSGKSNTLARVKALMVKNI